MFKTLSVRSCYYKSMVFDYMNQKERVFKSHILGVRTKSEQVSKQ